MLRRVVLSVSVYTVLALGGLGDALAARHPAVPDPAAGIAEGRVDGATGKPMAGTRRQGSWKSEKLGTGKYRITLTGYLPTCGQGGPAVPNPVLSVFALGGGVKSASAFVSGRGNDCHHLPGDWFFFVTTLVNGVQADVSALSFSFVNPASMASYIKSGNNGTASCDDFCQNVEGFWGEDQGGCVGAKAVDGSRYYKCSEAPGLNVTGGLVCKCTQF